MSSPLHTVLDSGAPRGSTNYSTLVLIHGLMWHSPTFKRLVSLAAGYNTRVIALNRRDYPGSAPYTSEERSIIERLADASPTSDVQDQVEAFMRNGAKDVYEALVELVRRENIPPFQDEGPHAQGGIVLIGWSFGAVWVLSFLVYAASFHSPGVDLSRYVRRVVAYDAPAVIYGYSNPPATYHPLHDSTLTLAERIQKFNEWVAAYYTHGDPIEADTLMLRRSLDAPSSLANMTTEELVESIHDGPGSLSDGSDFFIAQMYPKHGLYNRMKNAAFYLPMGSLAESKEGWDAVELRVMWCDRSIRSIVWAARCLSEELEEAKRTHRRTRKITLVQVRGANHFAHWDHPEKTMRAFLGKEDEV